MPKFLADWTFNVCTKFTKPIWVSRSSMVFFSLSFGSAKVVSLKWWVNSIILSPSLLFHTRHKINYGLIWFFVLLNSIAMVHIIFNFTSLMENDRDGMVTWNARNVPLLTTISLLSQVNYKLLLSIVNIILPFSRIHKQAFTCFNLCLIHLNLNLRT